jgi:SAM-dependent methyltransferase
MDLVELQDPKGLRHPWELARVAAVGEILAPYLYDTMRILDLGCGDGFVARELCGGMAGRKVTAVDINLTEERITELETFSGSIRYLREAPDDEKFDLLLVMDVLEHVKDDVDFLASSVKRHLSSGGKLMITVPSFQFLFGRHDVILGHYRRYRLGQAEEVAEASGLTILDSGYLFGTLLLPKLLYNIILGANSSSVGIGRWGGAGVVTALILKTLKLDNAFLRSAARLGIKFPGLSAWVLCQK